VKAFFNVDSTALPPDLRVGVFAPDMESKFAAWVRFSNGDPDGEHSKDLDKDIRGMAVKLMNVPGSSSNSQDFVMLTSKEFFSEDADDYIALHNALSESKFSILLYLGTHWKQAEILFRGKMRAANPLQVEYFSSVPYKLGARSMKFKARPCAGSDIHDEVPTGDPSPNYLRERLVSTLQSKHACYEFLVQPNMDPDSNSIENPMTAWDETKSPYIKVATINIPKQTEIDSEEHLNFCENLSFNPWHSLPETRPVGQINRMRLKIYPAISEFRHQMNHIPIIEPRSHEICTGETLPLCQTPKR
jgi:catalase